MKHPVWSTKEGRRVEGLARLLRWPAIGALVVGGGIIAARIFGPGAARELGRQGGEAFAEGIVDAQKKVAFLARASRWG